MDNFIFLKIVPRYQLSVEVDANEFTRIHNEKYGSKTFAVDDFENHCRSVVYNDLEFVVYGQYVPGKQIIWESVSGIKIINNIKVPIDIKRLSSKQENKVLGIVYDIYQQNINKQLKVVKMIYFPTGHLNVSNALAVMYHDNPFRPYKVEFNGVYYLPMNVHEEEFEPEFYEKIREIFQVQNSLQDLKKSVTWPFLERIS